METKNDYQILGIMSGTSLDGVDLALCKFSKNKKWEYEILANSFINPRTRYAKKDGYTISSKSR